MPTDNAASSSSIVPPGTCLIHGSFVGHACPSCSSFATVPGLNAPQRFELHPIPMGLQVGTEIPMFCSACGKPWRETGASARAYTCPCGSTKCEATVTFSG